MSCLKKIGSFRPALFLATYLVLPVRPILIRNTSKYRFCRCNENTVIVISSENEKDALITHVKSDLSEHDFSSL